MKARGTTSGGERSGAVPRDHWCGSSNGIKRGGSRGMIRDGRWGGAHVLLVPEVLGLRGLGDLEAHVVQVDALVLDVLAALGHVCLRARSAPSPGSMTADAGRGAGKGRQGERDTFSRDHAAAVPSFFQF